MSVIVLLHKKGVMLYDAERNHINKIEFILRRKSIQRSCYNEIERREI